MNDTPSTRALRSRGRGLGALRARRPGFIGLVGPFWSRPNGDSFHYAFMAETKHHNRRGVVQGGMLMTFADRSMGMTCWYANERQPQATVQLDVHFIDAVQVGEFVECQRQGRAPHALARVHGRRAGGRRARRRDGERRVEDAGEAVIKSSRILLVELGFLQYLASEMLDTLTEETPVSRVYRAMCRCAGS